jgi:hypothetical protein
MADLWEKQIEHPLMVSGFHLPQITLACALRYQSRVLGSEWRGALALLGLLVLAAGTGYGALRWYQQASRDPAFFEDDIRAFEAADYENPPAPGGIVFTGSSSIRFWSTLAEDMAPLPVRNRGFGGSQMSHLVHFARRIVTPHEPAAVVVFCGANDVSSGKTPEQVVADFEALLAIVREDAPEAHVYFLSIKPSPLRFARWPEIRRANAAVEALAAEASDLSRALPIRPPPPEREGLRGLDGGRATPPAPRSGRAPARGWARGLTPGSRVSLLDGLESHVEAGALALGTGLARADEGRSDGSSRPCPVGARAVALRRSPRRRPCRSGRACR